ncbi:hypothetical protein ALP12_05612 [Pseudomonas savastanoi pv. phaseolicola]|uniref:hypothetical protein n=1 Tax=Pseudomonas savastanoi TaxID=29438 RepID=UPI000EFF2AA8|nr:hypothetical protein [Pseudomonas savastanoi]RMV38630.1 hypothetical protein ALP12_05612 [Pseudomonas savastanoi pv. phaseolicola]
MLLDNKEIESVIENSLSIDFVSMVLTQNAIDDPRKYSGPGSIFLDADGVIHLKMYHVYQDDEDIQRDFGDSFNDDGLLPGKMIGDQHYYSLKAVDMKGRQWISSHISLSGNTSFPARGKIIETSLQKIILAHARTEGDEPKEEHAYIVFPGKYKIPCNTFEKGEKGTSLTICKLNLGDYNCEIKKRDSYMDMLIRGSSVMTIDKYSNILIESVSICVGAFLRPKLRIESSKEARLAVIYSAGKPSTQELQFPIDGMTTRESTHLEEFVRKYTKKIGEPFTELFGYWYRVFSESSGELENRALVLTTAIEGLLKKYFQEHGSPDSEFIAQVNDAKPKIKVVEIGKRVKDRILSSLGNAVSPTAKNSLHSLAVSGIIPDELIKIWNELRNKSAHADELKKSDAELQEFLDQLFGCLELFYCLLLRHIEYKGNYIRYSQTGWPAVPMS